MTASDIGVLVVGETQRPEFREARASLASGCRVREAADVESAVAVLSGAEFVPEVIVVAQAYPGQFSPAQIDRLRRLAPLARVLGLLGSWCEGEMRSGRPWPGAIRVYWHQWLPRWHQELARLRSGRCPAWGLPITATEEERLLASADQPPARCEGLIAIHARRFEVEDWLSAACRSRGYRTEWLQPHRPLRAEGAVGAIFDGTDLAGEELGQLARLVAALPGVPILVVMDFTRIEDHQRARSLGATAVLSKPLLLDDLFWQLDQALGENISNI
jgi:hypothetical protein